MEAITELEKEHRGIEVMLRIIDAVSTRPARGQEINSEDFNAILEFLSVFVDRCHHGKEEDFLFPALESAGVQRDQGPIGILLQEHEQGRQLVAELRNGIKNLLSGDKSAAQKIEKAGRDYVALLTSHIDKEENVLFPMAASLLGPDKHEELFESFEQLEKERIGPGKHEAFHELLHRLEQTYVS